MKIISESTAPVLRGAAGRRKTKNVWHFKSHACGSSFNEEWYILKSCGISDESTRSIDDGQVFDADKFWLSKPDDFFTLRFHTRLSASHDLCYVDHYYFSKKIESMILICFIGQHCEFHDKSEYKLFYPGDEQQKLKQNIMKTFKTMDFYESTILTLGAIFFIAFVIVALIAFKQLIKRNKP